MHDMDGNHEDIESRGNGWGGVGGVDGEAVVMQIEEGDLGEKHATDDENCEDGNAAEPETKDSEGLRSQDEGMRDSNQSALQEEEVKTATRDNSLKERKDVLESIHEATGESASSSPNSSAISSTLTLPIITREHSLEEEKAQRVTPITRNLPPTNPSNPPTTLIYSPKKKIYVPISTYRLRNSLLYGVAFLELANAGDFAANVWNQIPVPAFAAVLMGIGGFFALFISYFAFYDAYLSHQNYVSLRTEREFLSSQPPTRDAKAYLNVNYREMGTELLDRTGLDIFMGFGCVMVGIGTLMAIGGANPRVFRASNLLSGYIGNAPVAAFGLINAAWSIYIFRRAQHQFTASQRLLHDEAEIQSLLRQRTRRVQLHSTVLGAIGIFAGAASLVTAEHWEGYPVLIPCIIGSVWCNHIFRAGIGYDRSLLRSLPPLSLESIIGELKYLSSLSKVLGTKDGAKDVFPDSEDLESMLRFLVEYDMFEAFCVRFLGEKEVATAVLGPLDKEVVLEPSMLLRRRECFGGIEACVVRTVKEVGREKVVGRMRWLCEVLGAWAWVGDGERKGEGEK